MAAAVFTAQTVFLLKFRKKSYCQSLFISNAKRIFHGTAKKLKSWRWIWTSTFVSCVIVCVTCIICLKASLVFLEKKLLTCYIIIASDFEVMDMIVAKGP